MCNKDYIIVGWSVLIINDECELCICANVPR